MFHDYGYRIEPHLRMVQIFLYIILCTSLRDKCITPERSGYYMTKYISDECRDCIDFEGRMQSLVKILEKSYISIETFDIDCSSCDCKFARVTNTPTLTINNNGVEIMRFVGLGELTEYVNFIAAALKLPLNIINESKTSANGHIKEAEVAYFTEKQTSPRIIYVYKKKEQKKIQLLEKISTFYNMKVSVAYFDLKKSKTVREIIKKYKAPIVLGIYKDTIAPLNDKIDLLTVIKFVDQLIEPVFRDIDIDEFKTISKMPQHHNLPLFIVFTADFEAADKLFLQKAAIHKFNLAIFKTNDKRLYNISGISPNNEEEVTLTVYKNGSFHKYPYSITDSSRLNDWIFFSSFPNVTRLSGLNVNSILFGFKPVVILATQRNRFLEEFETISSKRHLGMPFDDFIFATIDVDEYPNFMSSIFKTELYPSIIIYNPLNKLFYKSDSNFDYFDKTVASLIRDFESSKLQGYGYTSSIPRYGIFIIIISPLVILAGVKAVKHLRKHKQNIEK